MMRLLTFTESPIKKMPHRYLFNNTSQVELRLGHVEAKRGDGFAAEPASQPMVESNLSQSLQP